MSDSFLSNCRITAVVSEKMIIANIFRFMHVVLEKNFLHDVHTQKAHFETHKYGVWISKKSKFEQNWLFVVLCLLCAHTTTYFVRKQKFYNVLRYLYYHSIWFCNIMIKCLHEIRKCYWIFNRFLLPKHAGFQRTLNLFFLPKTCGFPTYFESSFFKKIQHHFRISWRHLINMVQDHIEWWYRYLNTL